MLVSQLVATYSKLYHMAEDGSWPNIQEHGLLSTTALLDKWEYSGEEREEIEYRWRPSKRTIYHPKYGKAVIRDQKAIQPERLKKCLPEDIPVEEWCKFINRRVFFWGDWIGLKRFLSANEYIHKPHLVITVNPLPLIRRYASQITLSDINSGSTWPRKGQTDPEPRSFSTFKRIQDYQCPYVNELVVDYGIPDIVSFTDSVRRMIAHKKGDNYEPEELEIVWQPKAQ